jgi:hypothetical protein
MHRYDIVNLIVACDIAPADVASTMFSSRAINE